MRIVLQRVAHAKVTVEGQTVGAIEKGFLLFLGVSDTDTQEIAHKLVDKISRLRIFEDENGKTNRSLADAAGEVLVVSQFTLYADCKKGNRPSFAKAGKPETAKKLYEYVIECLKKNIDHVEHGSFGAHMEVELFNDGPFTLVLDSDEIC